MTTLTEAAENVAEMLRVRKYEYILNMMNGVLEDSRIKTVGIYGHIDDDGYYTFKAMSAVGADSPNHRHAEDLLLEGLRMNDIENVHSFIMLSRIPCEKCMVNIFKKYWHKLTIMIPSRLDSKSKWFKTQVNALAYMNDNMKIDEESGNLIYSLVYIDD